MDEVKQKMAAAVDFVRRDMATIRTGRANPAILENLIVDVYGGTAKMKVMEVATLAHPEPQMITLTPYDGSIIGDIRKGIEAANLGVSAQIDNNLIRVVFPPLTQERRMEYVKLLHVKLEDGRVKVRQIRHDKMSELKRVFEAKEITEDDRKRNEKELQDLTDRMMQEIETAGKAKEQELMTI